MSLPETILFSLAKRLYQSELGHSSEMKDALQSENAYADFRSQQSQFVLNAAAACGIRLKGKVVVDFGCFDGAITSRYADAEVTVLVNPHAFMQSAGIQGVKSQANIIDASINTKRTIISCCITDLQCKTRSICSCSDKATFINIKTRCS